LFNEIKPITLRDQVVEEIRRAIFEGRLKPGDHIREQDLTQHLGVSRTPIREAFIILERDGLLVNYPNRGCFVRNFDEQDIREIFTMRAALENLAAELIIDKLTDEDFAHLRKLIEQQRLAIEQDDRTHLGLLDLSFHLYLVERAHNSRLTRAWQAISAQYVAAISYRASAYPDYDEHQALTDHEQILKAYMSRDLNRVMKVNHEINERVAHQCLQGLLIQKQARTEEVNTR